MTDSSSSHLDGIINFNDDLDTLAAELNLFSPDLPEIADSPPSGTKAKSPKRGCAQP